VAVLGSPNLEEVSTKLTAFVFELPNVNRLDVEVLTVVDVLVVELDDGTLSPSNFAKASSAVRDEGLYKDTLEIPAICALV
jgi:hypothetical protein